MLSIIFSYLLGLFATILYLLLTVFFLRLTNKISPIKIMIFSILPAYCIVFFIGQEVEFWGYSSIFFSGVIIILFVFGGLYKSISVRILCDLLESKSRGLLIEKIFEKYLLEESFRGRLDILVKSEVLERNNNDIYILSKKGKKLYYFVSFFQYLYGVKNSG